MCAHTKSPAANTQSDKGKDTHIRNKDMYTSSNTQM